MSLNIYRNIKDIPKGVNYIASNDLYILQNPDKCFNVAEYGNKEI
jgi:hypothetical protein